MSTGKFFRLRFINKMKHFLVIWSFGHLVIYTLCQNSLYIYNLLNRYAQLRSFLCKACQKTERPKDFLLRSLVTILFTNDYRVLNGLFIKRPIKRPERPSSHNLLKRMGVYPQILRWNGRNLQVCKVFSI